MIDPQTGTITFWTADTGIDGHNPVDGRGTFRRFQAQLHNEHPHLLSAWQAFRDNRARRRAVEWLADQSLITHDAATHYLATHPDVELP